MPPPHPLTKFEIQKYYQNERKFSGVYSRNNSLKIKHGAYVINLDENKSIRTHWIALCVNRDNVTYLYSFGVEYLPKKKKNRQQKYQNKHTKDTCKLFNSVCIILYWIIDFMLKGKSWLDHTNLFCPNKYEKNDKIILKHFH